MGQSPNRAWPVGRDTLFHRELTRQVVDPPHRCSPLYGRAGRMRRDWDFVVSADEHLLAIAEDN
jgi:hypothetical protein